MSHSYPVESLPLSPVMSPGDYWWSFNGDFRFLTIGDRWSFFIIYRWSVILVFFFYIFWSLICSRSDVSQWVVKARRCVSFYFGTRPGSNLTNTLLHLLLKNISPAPAWVSSTLLHRWKEGSHAARWVVIMMVVMVISCPESCEKWKWKIWIALKVKVMVFCCNLVPGHQDEGLHSPTPLLSPGVGREVQFPLITITIITTTIITIINQVRG